MVDPERLLNGGTDFERRLLQGGIAERPGSDLTRKMAMGVGISGTLAYSSTAKAALQSWWGKAALAVSIGTGVAGVIVMSQGEPSGVEPRQAQAPTTLATAPVTAPEVLIQGEASVPVDQARPEVVKEQAPPRKLRRQATSTAARSTLAQEIKLLDRARALIRSGDTAGAVGVLNTYQRRYPKGVLQREAGVLRARALDR